MDKRSASNQAIVMNRRGWLAGLAATALAGRVWAEPLGPDGPKDREVEEVLAIARKAGLGDLRTRSSSHYLGIGNAPADFSETALKLCEGLMTDFLAAFQKRDFKLVEPKGRLTIVTLADPTSFEAFFGAKPDPSMPGYFDLDTNRLVLFDNRATGEA